MLRLLIILLILSFENTYAQYVIKNTYKLETQVTTKSAHASTLIETKPNHLLAAWFGGEYEGHSNVGIYLSEFDGINWTKAKQIAFAETIEGKTYPCWNPVLVKNSENTLFLYYKVGPNPREWWGQVITSNDFGKTWSKPQRLPKSFLGPIRAKSLILDNNTFLHLSSTETPNTDWWSIHIEKSDNKGQNWEKITIDCDSIQVIQPTYLLLPKNKIMLLSRSRHNKIIATHSEDFGQTWSKLYPINLPNPNAGIDALSINENLHLMVYNPLTAGKEWWEGRSKLVLGESSDGINWKEIIKLEDHEIGEYSYPAIIKTQDGSIHISYTFDRKFIKHHIIK